MECSIDRSLPPDRHRFSASLSSKLSHQKRTRSSHSHKKQNLATNKNQSFNWVTNQPTKQATCKEDDASSFVQQTKSIVLLLSVIPSFLRCLRRRRRRYCRYSCNVVFFFTFCVGITLWIVYRTTNKYRYGISDPWRWKVIRRWIPGECQLRLLAPRIDPVLEDRRCKWGTWS